MTDKIYISLREYWRGDSGIDRDKVYAKELTDEIRKNAQHTVDCTNKLLAMAEADGVNIRPIYCASGWRPKSLNSSVPGSYAGSPHILALAIDLREYPDNRLRKWIDANPSKVKEAGFVAVELFSYTRSWVHLQVKLPNSWETGRIIYAPAEDGWKHWKLGTFYKSILTVK